MNCVLRYCERRLLDKANLQSCPRCHIPGFIANMAANTRECSPYCFVRSPRLSRLRGVYPQNGRWKAAVVRLSGMGHPNEMALRTSHPPTSCPRRPLSLLCARERDSRGFTGLVRITCRQIGAFRCADQAVLARRAWAGRLCQVFTDESLDRRQTHSATPWAAHVGSWRVHCECMLNPVPSDDAVFDDARLTLAPAL